MAYTSDLNAQGWGTLDPAPSTRDSTHLLTKWYPINKTLSVAGTAQDLFTVTPMPATVNLVPNPSFETGAPPTGFAASGATITQSNTYAKYGTYSLKINPDNSAAGEGAYWEIGQLPGRADNKLSLSISCYFRDAASSSSGVRVRLVATNTTPFASGTVNYLNGSTVALSTSWQRSTLSTTIAASDTYTVYLVTATKHNIDFYADGFQVETMPSVTDYCDGDQNAYCSWDGIAHASTSRRINAIGSIRNFTLTTDKDIYVAYDGTASATNGRFVSAGGTWWIDHPVYITKNISFINKTVGETPTITGEIWGCK